MIKRRLEKQIAIRVKASEKELIKNYLKENDLELQDILRGYILNLLTNDNTPIYTTKI